MQEIFKIIGNVNKEEGVTILLVEQNANMALSIADRGYVLRKRDNFIFWKGLKELISIAEIKKSLPWRVQTSTIFIIIKWGNLIEIPLFYCFFIYFFYISTLNYFFTQSNCFLL